MMTGHFSSSLQSAAGAASLLSSGMATFSPTLLGSSQRLGSYSLRSSDGNVLNTGVVLSTGSLLPKGDNTATPGLSDVASSFDATVLQVRHIKDLLVNERSRRL